jgi:hypothetical protein
MDFIFESLQAQFKAVLEYMQADTAEQQRKAMRNFIHEHRKAKGLINAARQDTGQPVSDLQDMPQDSGQGSKSDQL